MNFLVITKLMKDFWNGGTGLGLGSLQSLYVKPHQATDHFLKVLKTYDV